MVHRMQWNPRLLSKCLEVQLFPLIFNDLPFDDLSQCLKGIDDQRI